MKWKKLGCIFDFKDSIFAKKFVSHAQSPQAVVFDDFVRVYFSTRIKDTPTSFISVPQFVDFTKNFKNIINVSKDEIITRGNLGCFDEHGIFPFSPVKIDNKIYAYTSGWTRRISVDVDSAIGLAISDNNGNTFKRIADGPILSASLNEPFLVADGFVRNFNDRLYMFYIYGVKWCEPTNKHPAERVYKISYATSHNGIDWIKSNHKIIQDTINNDECQALPTVIEIDGIYHMYFCYRDMLDFRTHKGKGYKLGYAYSKDLTSWIRDDVGGGLLLSHSGWDSEMMCYPHIFSVDNKIYLLYNGNNFGKDGFGLAILEDV